MHRHGFAIAIGLVCAAGCATSGVPRASTPVAATAPAPAPVAKPVWSAQAPNLLVFTFLEDDSHRLVQQLERQLGARTCGDFESAQWDGASRIVVYEQKTRVKNSVILVIEPTAPTTDSCAAGGGVHVPPEAWALIP